MGPKRLMDWSFAVSTERPSVVHQRHRRAASLVAWGNLSRGEVSEWLMVPLSKSGVRKHRGFESHPLRHYAFREDADPCVGGPPPSLTDT